LIGEKAQTIRKMLFDSYVTVKAYHGGDSMVLKKREITHERRRKVRKIMMAIVAEGGE